ncbi:hypothetical protein Sjap_022549 [Stephania japonica]|uniref:Uncharacterized protein n=1 Tax=Stephania japonica TaxID=461633 RepID=A0AAP0EUH1_9MAGN
MELSTIRDAFDHVSKKQKLCSSKTEEIIDQISLEIKQTIADLDSFGYSISPDDYKSILTGLSVRLSEMGALNHLDASQKEVNAGMSKCLKLLEKYFIPDISKAYRSVDYDMHTVNQIVACHFYRQGMFDLGDCFINEAREPEANTLRSPFLELYQILEAIGFRNLQPALKWAASNRERLMQSGSTLEMKLHQLQFMEILQKNKEDALKYARNFLAPFASLHMAEIQKLMACLLWAGRLDCSPYAELLSPTHWEELPGELTRQFCSLLGHSYGSPLSVVIEAGAQGLPTLLKLVHVMAAKTREWQEMKQMPVPVELGREFQFHSIFVCPVLREQGSEENPPMLMPCGHMLGKESILKLSKNGSRLFKCSYCPLETSVDLCMLLHF